MHNLRPRERRGDCVASGDRRRLCQCAQISVMQRFGALYRGFEHALLAACTNFGLLKAIKGAILDGKPSESGECRLTPMLGWSGT